MTSDYKIVEIVGEGISGRIYKVKSLNGNFWALKTIDLDFHKHNEILEIDVISRLSHPHIINMEKILILDNKRIGLLTPISDPPQTLQKCYSLSLEEKTDIMYKCAKGLEFLHIHGILHLDFKLENILLTELGPRIIDFGTSLLHHLIDEPLHIGGPITTPYIRPPEITNIGGPLGGFSDVWSFSISMFMFLGKLSIDDIILLISNDRQTMILDSQIDEVFENHKMATMKTHLNDQGLIDFFISIINVDYNKRMTTKEITLHPLFKNFSSIEGKINRLSKSNPHYYNERFYTARNIIITIFKSFFRDDYAISLFYALDLLHRSLPAIQKKNSHRWHLVAASCIMLGLRSDTGIENFLLCVDKIIIHLNLHYSDYFTEKELLLVEKKVIRYVAGVIFSCPLYEQCTNGHQLKLAYRQILISDDASGYLKLDIPLWLEGIDQGPTDLNKNITIAELLQKDQ